MHMEEWRYIESEDLQKHAYMVSSFGNIRSEDRIVESSNGTLRKLKGKVLATHISNAGYVVASAYRNHSTVHLNIHREVYKTFVGDIPDNYDIHHIDHNRLNNHVENLDVLTRAENTKEQVMFNNGIYKDSHNVYNTHKCKECGIPTSYKSTYCRKHAPSHSPRNYKNGFIEKETLVELLTKDNGNFTIVGKELGITDNAVRNWCKKYDLPYRTKEWKHLSN